MKNNQEHVLLNYTAIDPLAIICGVLNNHTHSNTKVTSYVTLSSTLSGKCAGSVSHAYYKGEP